MSDAPKLKVFISYSRADARFADELVAGLEFKEEFAVTIDRHSIVEGEDWKKRLGALIADADTIVFILSPDSPKDAPDATVLHLDFMRASERAEDDRRNAERRQLQEMASAQSQRAVALQEREAAVKRLQVWTDAASRPPLPAASAGPASPIGATMPSGGCARSRRTRAGRLPKLSRKRSRRRRCARTWPVSSWPMQQRRVNMRPTGQTAGIRRSRLQ
jgi:hypothetical protein